MTLTFSTFHVILHLVKISGVYFLHGFQPSVMLRLLTYLQDAIATILHYGGDDWSRTSSAIRRWIYSPLGLPIFLHLHMKIRYLPRIGSTCYFLIAFLRIFKNFKYLGVVIGSWTQPVICFYKRVISLPIAICPSGLQSCYAYSQITCLQTYHIKNLIQKLTAICFWIQWSLQAVLNILHCWTWWRPPMYRHDPYTVHVIRLSLQLTLVRGSKW